MMQVRLFRSIQLPLVIAIVLLLSIAARSFADENAASRPSECRTTSPNGRIRIELSLRGSDGASQQLVYRVFLQDRPVVLPSALEVRMADGSTLGTDCTIEKDETRQIDATFEQFPGKRRTVVDRGNETTLWLRERGATPRSWQVVVRAYDDGVALRYRFPAQDGWRSLELAEERTEFQFSRRRNCDGAAARRLHHSHENRYQQHVDRGNAREGSCSGCRCWSSCRAPAGRPSWKRISPITRACILRAAREKVGRC